MESEAAIVTPDCSIPSAGAKSFSPSKAGFGPRIAGGLVSAACAAVLGIGAWLTPAAEGHGSHTQLGLPPCMWAVSLHRPCPTCGMTTAVSEAVHGHLWKSFVTQPFGFAVAFGAAVALLVGLHVASTGSQLGRLFDRLMSPRVLWILAGLVGVSWAYKWATWPQS